MEKFLTSRSAEETERIAAELAESLRPGAVLALYGDLGAGKTCFIRGLARGLGVTRVVHSPTFTLINEYPGRVSLFHMDLYRIAHADEALDFGLDDYLFGAGVCAIEWAERVEKLLPPETIRVVMRLGEGEEVREISIVHGPAGSGERSEVRDQRSASRDQKSAVSGQNSRTPELPNSRTPPLQGSGSP